MTEQIDALIEGWYVVTMNETRDIIHHGAVAIRGNQIVDVGKASDLSARYDATEIVPNIGLLRADSATSAATAIAVQWT